MKTIKISDATYRALAGKAILPFCSTGTRQADGSWLVPVEDGTYERLEQMRLHGESDDDLIQRIIGQPRTHPRQKKDVVDSAKSSRAGGMKIHQIDSPRARAELTKRGLATRDLETAVLIFQKTEGVHAGTLIGINEHGFFGSTRDNWRSDQPDAFAEPLFYIPWVQILELLGRVPQGTTGEFLAGGAKKH
jgi:predicted CopG family antitoxin